MSTDEVQAWVAHSYPPMPVGLGHRWVGHMTTWIESPCPLRRPPHLFVVDLVSEWGLTLTPLLLSHNLSGSREQLRCPALVVALSRGQATCGGPSGFCLRELRVGGSLWAVVPQLHTLSA